MSHPCLPQEISDYIVDLLQDEHQTLKQCCLVSKSWVPHARMHIFRVIRFESPTDPALDPEFRVLVLVVMSLPREQKNIRDCIGAIEAHVAKYPDLMIDPRFGLILDGRYTTPPPAGSENRPPPIPEAPYHFNTPKPIDSLA